MTRVVYDNVGQVLKVGDSVVYQYDKTFNRKFIGKICEIGDHATAKLHRTPVLISVIQSGSEILSHSYNYSAYADQVTVINPNVHNELAEATRKIEYLLKEVEKLEAELAIQKKNNNVN